MEVRFDIVLLRHYTGLRQAVPPGFPKQVKPDFEHLLHNMVNPYCFLRYWNRKTLLDIEIVILRLIVFRRLVVPFDYRIL